MLIPDGRYKTKTVVRWRGVPTQYMAELHVQDAFLMLVLQYEPDGFTHRYAVEVFHHELHPLAPPTDGAVFLLLREVTLSDPMKQSIFGPGPFPPE